MTYRLHARSCHLIMSIKNLRIVKWKGQIKNISSTELEQEVKSAGYGTKT